LTHLQQVLLFKDSREIDRVLKEASPRALVRHSGSGPPKAKLEWQLVVDEEPLDAPNGSCPEVFYCPEAILAMIYTSGTTGEAKGVMLTHTNVLSNVYSLNYLMARAGSIYTPLEMGERVQQNAEEDSSYAPT
jgi:long-subunit acyl-CoA synthetase (AMP-forming)